MKTENRQEVSDEKGEKDKKMRQTRNENKGRMREEREGEVERRYM